LPAKSSGPAKSLRLQNFLEDFLESIDFGFGPSQYFFGGRKGSSVAFKKAWRHPIPVGGLIG
jgi:hypothetical protein